MLQFQRAHQRNIAGGGGKKKEDRRQSDSRPFFKISVSNLVNALCQLLVGQRLGNGVDARHQILVATTLLLLVVRAGSGGGGSGTFVLVLLCFSCWVGVLKKKKE